MSSVKKALIKYKNLAAPVKASLWYTVGSVINKGIALFLTPVFTRILTTAQYGAFSISQSWVSILIIFTSLNIFLGGYSLYYFGASLFGGNIDYSVNIGLKYFVVDSGLLLLLQDWGLIITALMCVIFVMLMRMLMKNREYALIVYTLIIILWSFNEDVFISVGSNFAFYIFGYELRKRYINAHELKQRSKNEYLFI